MDKATFLQHLSYRESTEQITLNSYSQKRCKQTIWVALSLKSWSSWTYIQGCFKNSGNNILNGLPETLQGLFKNLECVSHVTLFVLQLEPQYDFQFYIFSEFTLLGGKSLDFGVKNLTYGRFPIQDKLEFSCFIFLQHLNSDHKNFF